VTSRAKPPQIAGIEIRDGVVDYVDEASGQEATLSSLEWMWAVVDRSIAARSHPFLTHTQFLPPDGVWVQLECRLNWQSGPPTQRCGAKGVGADSKRPRLEGDVPMSND